MLLLCGSSQSRQSIRDGIYSVCISWMPYFMSTLMGEDGIGNIRNGVVRRFQWGKGIKDRLKAFIVIRSDLFFPAIVVYDSQRCVSRSAQTRRIREPCRMAPAHTHSTALIWSAKVTRHLLSICARNFLLTISRVLMVWRHQSTPFIWFVVLFIGETIVLCVFNVFWVVSTHFVQVEGVWSRIPCHQRYILIQWACVEVMLGIRQDLHTKQTMCYTEKTN